MADRVHIDFETYSEANLKKVGAWAYSEHPSTEVLCMQFAINENDPQLWLPTDGGPPLPLLEAIKAGSAIHAWTSFFEYAIWVNVLKWPVPPLEQWRDTAAKAAALALPRALGDCGAVLGLPQDKVKDKRGKQLIQRYCKPHRGKRIIEEDGYRELYDYCAQDVIAEREIDRRLKPLSSPEQEIWVLDQKINLRGIAVDVASVPHAIDIIEQEKIKFEKEVQIITNGKVADTNKREQVLNYAEAQGYKLENYTRGYLLEAVNDPAMPDNVRRLLQIRLDSGKTSVAKYPSLSALTENSSDGRIRGMLMYHGASTGRWTGRLFQVHNLPRPSFKNSEPCIALLKYRNPDEIDFFYGNPMEALSSCIRGMLWAASGKRFFVADYSGIEARVIAWLAGQKDVLKIFASGGDVYKHAASAIYKKDVAKITDSERTIGKVATLALGYQGAQGAFQDMAKIYQVKISDDEAAEIVSKWRSSNPHIKKYWYLLNKAAIAAVRKPATVFKVKNVAFKVIGKFLYCKLPSGRVIAYFSPHMAKNKFGQPCVGFWGSDNGKWCLQDTYGGKLAENITQGIARDIMAGAMLKAEEKRYPIVFTVHDEIVAEVPKDYGSMDKFCKIMEELPPWAEGLPLKVEGYESARYRK